MAVCNEDVVAHHCAGGEFSRWIADVLGDPPLAAAIAAVEAEVRDGATSNGRDQLLGVIHDRHPG